MNINEIKLKLVEQKEQIERRVSAISHALNRTEPPVSYTHLTLPTKA